MISVILLSGGLSSRFGSPKALALWKGQPLICHLQNMLLSTCIDEIVVVLGANAQKIRPCLLKHKKMKVVYNKDYKLGQTSSFKAGLGHVSPSARAVGLLPVDFPLVSAQTINRLAQEFLQKNPLILVPTFLGQKGHPPLFNISLRLEILNLPDDAGLNTISQNRKTDTRYCPVDDQGIMLSFNTPQEFARISQQ